MLANAKHIQPHFIKNTLTSLLDWVEESPAQSVIFIQALAREFDLLNGMAEATLIPVRQELELCQNHLRVMQFRGTGRLVLATERAPMAMKVVPESPLLVAATALAGWIGRVVPRVLMGPDGPTPYVECTGEGALLLMPAL